MYLHQHEMFHLPALLCNLFSSGFPPERAKDSIAEGIERLPKQIANQFVTWTNPMFSLLCFDYDAENRWEAPASRLNLEVQH